jgi:DNA-binding NarL/FixJ family response regulator
MTAAEPVRVLLADDHPLYRRGLHQLLDAQAGTTVVGEVEDGVAAVEQARALQPDVVVMDLNMPVVDGVEATRQVVSASPHIAVLVLTMHDDDDSVFAAMRAGARGYLLKGADGSEILRAVQAVAGGEAIFGPSVARRVLEWFAAPRPAAVSAVFPGLTEREHEVLDLIAAGRNNPDIAATLVLSPKTVRNHVSNIFAKLQVADRAEAIVRAREAGLGRG